MIPFIISISAALLVALAEWLHAGRIRRISRLAFLPTGRPRAWTLAVPIIRPVAFALATWGLLTLLTLDGAPVRLNESKHKPDRHLLIALDASPSMFIRDAGEGGKQLRRERAADVLRSVFQRLDMDRTRISIVAFYTTAKTVVVDTNDLNVVHNVLSDLPLEYAFKEGQTNMYAGVREAAKLAEKNNWPAHSATLIVVSDGDTLPDALPPVMPPAIADTLVLGVGNPYRGTSIAGHSSRQDISSLRGLAARLRGVYHDGNEKHLPTTTLAGLSMLRAEEDQQASERTIALIAAGLGASILASLAPLLTFFGAPRLRYHGHAARDELASTSRHGQDARATAHHPVPAGVAT